MLKISLKLSKKLLDKNFVLINAFIWNIKPKRKYFNAEKHLTYYYMHLLENAKKKQKQKQINNKNVDCGSICVPQSYPSIYLSKKSH